MTRRCLECDHQFCVGPPAQSSSSSRPRSPRGRKRKRNRGGPCKAEFDYTGWSLYNSWRRTVLPSPPSSPLSESDSKKQKTWGDEYAAVTAARDGFHDGGSNNPQEPFNDRRDNLFVRKKHNCWLHCDFPSECHHAIYRAQQEGRPILAAAEALDAASAAAEAAGERLDKRDARRHDKKAGSTVNRDAKLSTVTEEAGEEEYLDELHHDENKENVSPCSPEPPRDLMCEPEVSPITPIDGDKESPITGSKNSEYSMWDDINLNDPSTKATTVGFEIYADDTRTTATHPTEQQYHDNEPNNFNAEFYHSTQEAAESRGQSFTVYDLENAYSEQAWFTATTEGDRPDNDSSPRKSPERRFRRDKMFALLGRRNAITTIGTATTSPDDNTTSHMTANQDSDHQRRRGRKPLDGSEEWESWSDDSSSSSSSSSSACSVASIFDGDIGRGGGVDLVTVVDLDGDSTMPEALSPIYEEDADSMLSPVTPVKEDGKDGEPDLISLLRLRNAFMKGDV